MESVSGFSKVGFVENYGLNPCLTSSFVLSYILCIYFLPQSLQKAMQTFTDFIIKSCGEHPVGNRKLPKIYAELQPEFRGKRLHAALGEMQAAKGSEKWTPNTKLRQEFLEERAFFSTK